MKLYFSLNFRTFPYFLMVFLIFYFSFLLFVKKTPFNSVKYPRIMVFGLTFLLTYIVRIKSSIFSGHGSLENFQLNKSKDFFLHSKSPFSEIYNVDEFCEKNPGDVKCELRNISKGIPENLKDDNMKTFCNNKYALLYDGIHSV